MAQTSSQAQLASITRPESPPPRVIAQDDAFVHLGDNHTYYVSQSGGGSGGYSSRDFVYEDMQTRTSAITNAHPSTCEWIWQTEFRTWLSDGLSSAFWITGKPGSGKSTLMKYLAEKPEGQEILATSGSKWLVLKFFFDFRSGKKMPNSIEGLQRSLLHQILRQSSDRWNETVTGLEALTDLSETFKSEIAKQRRSMFILIDGLDEFEDDMASLVGLLLPLPTLSHLKLCLASRKNPVLSEMLNSLPCLRMSDHNTEGIHNHIKMNLGNLANGSTWRKALDLPRMEMLLYERAEGVFLWVSLATREIKRSLARGATAQELEDLLQSLPSELGDMYKRIIDRMSARQRNEAAIYYTLLESSNSYGITLELLFNAVQFLAFECRIAALPTGIINNEHFLARFDATMDGLYEVSNVRSVISDEKFCLTPRLMHETVRAFSDRSNWVCQWLPPEFARDYKSFTWIRLCSQALIVADIYAAQTHNYMTRWLKDFSQIESRQRGSVGQMDDESFANMLEKHFPGHNIVRWSGLLRHSMEAINIHGEESIKQGDEAGIKFTTQALCSSWIRLRCRMWFESHGELVPSVALLQHPSPDLLLAAAHHCYDYLGLQIDRIRRLSDSERDALVLTILCKPDIMHRSWRDRERAGFNAAQRHIVETILVHNKKIDSFHVTIFLYMGYIDSPSFLKGRPISGLSLSPDTIITPVWQGPLPVCLHEPPLMTWACEKFTPANTALKSRSELDVLQHLGIDMNVQSSKGCNIVHWLTEHVISHTFVSQLPHCWPEETIIPAIEKLYFVEEAGADFSYIHNTLTPRQAFREAHNMIRSIPEEELINVIDETANIRLQQIDFMLEHKELTQHLPQPSLISNYRGRANVSKLKDRIESKHCDICATRGRRMKQRRWPGLQDFLTDTAAAVTASSLSRSRDRSDAEWPRPESSAEAPPGWI